MVKYKKYRRNKKLLDNENEERKKKLIPQFLLSLGKEEIISVYKKKRDVIKQNKQNQ